MLWSGLSWILFDNAEVEPTISQNVSLRWRKISISVGKFIDARKFSPLNSHAQQQFTINLLFCKSNSKWNCAIFPNAKVTDKNFFKLFRWKIAQKLKIFFLWEKNPKLRRILRDFSSLAMLASSLNGRRKIDFCWRIMRKQFFENKNSSRRLCLATDIPISDMISPDLGRKSFFYSIEHRKIDSFSSINIFELFFLHKQSKGRCCAKFVFIIYSTCSY